MQQLPTQLDIQYGFKAIHSEVWWSRRQEIATFQLVTKEALKMLQPFVNAHLKHETSNMADTHTPVLLLL